MILAGDIGGTKTVLASYQHRDGDLIIQQRRSYACSDFHGLLPIISNFRECYGIENPEAACFGIAGPVIADVVQATNLPWKISVEALRTELDTAKVTLLNDLEAASIGIMQLPDSELAILNTGVVTQGNKAVIAAGTGLGEAILFWDGRQHRPFATEGGHTDFAPRSEQQDEMLRWLRKRHHGRVSVERVLSGPGLYQIYQFLAESGFAAEPSNMQQQNHDFDPGAEISRLAHEDKDPLCVETLRLFTDIYGAETGNLALKTLALGGVYLTGGIAPKILTELEAGDFMHAYADKGRFRELLEKIPVKVALNQDTVLIGAACHALSLLQR